MHSLSEQLDLFGRRLAVGAGALCALVSLLVDTPVWVASARGVGTTMAVLLFLRVTRSLVGATLAAEPAALDVTPPDPETSRP